MFFNKDKFFKVFKKKLLQKNFDIVKKFDNDVYQISRDRIDMKIDAEDVRKSFENDINTKAVDELIASIELDFVERYKLISFNNAEAALRIILMRKEDVKDNYISNIFYDNICKVIAYVGNEKTVYPLDSSYLKKWGIPKDVVVNVADRNMCEILISSKLNVISNSGIKYIDFSDIDNTTRASLMACMSFRKTIADKLGTKFLVIAPTAETMYAIEDVRNDVVESMGNIIAREYRKSENKLSTSVYLYTSKGITVEGKFNIPEDKKVV